MKNETYSLRAFARGIGLTSGNLSDILNKKICLSLDKPTAVVTKLNLPIEDPTKKFKLVEITANPKNRKTERRVIVKTEHKDQDENTNQSTKFIA